MRVNGVGLELRSSLGASGRYVWLPKVCPKEIGILQIWQLFRPYAGSRVDVCSGPGAEADGEPILSDTICIGSDVNIGGGAGTVAPRIFSATAIQINHQ